MRVLRWTVLVGLLLGAFVVPLGAQNGPSNNALQLVQTVEGWMGDESTESFAIQGDTMVIGDAFANGISNGEVQIYQRNAGQWSPTQTLSGLNESDWFGWSVALDGDRLAVGAPCDGPIVDGFLTCKGVAYLFELDNTNTWVQIAKFEGVNKNDWFGWSLALEGNILVVGSHRSRGFNETKVPGLVYVYEPDAGGDWVLSQLIEGDEADDGFGLSVDMDNGILVVGAGPFDGGEEKPIYTKVYEFKNDQWEFATKVSQTTSLLPYTLKVNVSGGYVFVFSIPPGTWTQGQMEIYRKIDNSWQRKQLIAPESSNTLGVGVGVHEDLLVIGDLGYIYGVGRILVYQRDATEYVLRTILEGNQFQSGFG